jgi:hydrogenase expression/formation protein HypE
MAHGGGGRMMHDLIEGVFSPLSTGNGARHDGTIVGCGTERIAYTTDTFVVSPLFFPGGDIGRLAVFGTVNDLAMCGARPEALSAGFILEDGFDLELLQRIVASMSAAAAEVGVRIVTGDTKVVERGKGDGLYINTSGIGRVRAGVEIGPARVRKGDAIILSGDLGRHGIALMAVREGLQFETKIQSDCANLWPAVDELLQNPVDVHCLRDLTRGGLASALVEIAEASDSHLTIREGTIPVSDAVLGACEILGLDPLHVANEGRFCVFVPADQAEATVKALRSHEVCSGACIVGEVGADLSGVVSLRTVLGTDRLIDMPSGEQLPRIC